MSYPSTKLRLLKRKAPVLPDTPKRPNDGENYSREILAEWIEQHLREAMTLCSTQQPATSGPDKPSRSCQK